MPFPEPAFDPDLTFDALVELIDRVLSEALSLEEQSLAFAFLETNLPGADVQVLIEWPGKWFGNRWYEEQVLPPDEVAQHALHRCGRTLPGQPEDGE